MTESEEDFLGVTAAAEYLSVSPMTVRRWIKSGYLPSIWVGSRIRIMKKDLEEIKSGRKPPQD